MDDDSEEQLSSAMQGRIVRSSMSRETTRSMTTIITMVLIEVGDRNIKASIDYNGGGDWSFL